MLLKLKGLLEVRDGEVYGIASTEDLDRHNEIIKQDGWDLTKFKENPVILAHHNYHDFPIGQALEIGVEGGKLVFKMLFTSATEEAKQAYQLVKEGVMRTFSVGYIPREYDANDQRITTKAELLEISLVTVPSNASAVVMAKGMEKNDLAQSLVKYWMMEKKLAQEVETLEKESGEKGAIADELNAEQIWELKREKLSPVYDIFWAFCDVYWKEETPVEDFSMLLTEMIGLMGAAADGASPMEEKAWEEKGIDSERREKFKQFLAAFAEKGSTSQVGNDETLGEEGGEVEKRDLDIRLIQKVTGNLQELLFSAKQNRKGGVK